MHSKILKWIIILIILIMILTVIILLINKNNIGLNNNSNWIDTTVNNDGIYPEAEDLKYNNIEQLEDIDDFATIYNYIQEFLDYTQNNKEKAMDLVDVQYKQKNSVKFEFYTNAYKFIPKSIYYENEKLTITRYYVFGAIKENEKNEYKNMVFVFRCNFDNMTISLIPIENYSDENIKDIKNNINYINNEIEENENNRLVFARMNDNELLELYMDRYIYLANVNPKEVYNNLLDKDYKDKRFENYDDFIKHIDLNKEKFNDFVKIGYKKIEENEKNKYIIEDSYKNNYIFIENKFMDYTIMLDTYTILDNDYRKKYFSLNDNEKAYTNVDMFIKMINTKDYKHAYEKLDETFRNNNFQTLDLFIQYINNNFYANNYLTLEKIDNLDDIYILKVKILSSISTSAESKEKQFLIKLEEGTDFILSFDI